ncbi:hypothetical protein PR202_ga21187 [Eleusine coracana subsp. coracana]|uniref:F-box domain-containing protein n=1 Tax=Eleusine coracana subsp. coracana TaxID=191504 RepID=A0AAV5D0Q3_ELECO|nr:hypothetical protein PR202_ga21187 [Eleusine coracana subsp. coracana]
MDTSPRRKPRPAATPSFDSLPPEILEKIVSCLFLRDSVRTSALSRHWRHRWESVPGLCILRSDDAPPAAFSTVLVQYGCPVREFIQCFLHRNSYCDISVF